ncbi:MAG: hypothetical protein HOZ81_36405 [Streptomyces sp.]|nr:hypothetical protein [Streptomyces sp.]
MPATLVLAGVKGTGLFARRYGLTPPARSTTDQQTLPGARHPPGRPLPPSPAGISTDAERRPGVPASLIYFGTPSCVLAEKRLNFVSTRSTPGTGMVDTVSEARHMSCPKPKTTSQDIDLVGVATRRMIL